MTRRGLSRVIAVAVVAALFGMLHAPRVLAFPFRAQVGDVTVYAEQPISPSISGIIADANRRVAASSIAAPLGQRSIYLTDGGWRWTLLALQSRGAFAVTRGFTKAIVVNRSDIAANAVANGAAIAGTRSLAGTIAHETTHLLIYHRYGMIRPLRFPTWKHEGYCDYVAQESSLSDAEAARLHGSGQNVPALAYHDGRLRVAALLARDPDVDHLFAD